MLKRLVGYAAFMFGANALTALLTFSVTTFGMVAVSKETFGDYGLYMRVYQIGQGLFIYGANASVQRFAAEDPENRSHFTAMALWLFLVLFFACGIAGAGVAYFWSWRYALGLIGIPWVVLWWWARYIVRSNIDAKREAALVMVASLANSLGQGFFLTFTREEDALIYGDFLALIASGIAGLVVLRTGVGVSFLELLKRKIPRSLVVESVRFGTPVWWSGQIFQVKHQLSGIWTASKIGKEGVATLDSMGSMWQFAQKPMEYLSQAALPGLVSAKEERRKLYGEILRLCLVAFTCVGIAVAAGIPLLFQVVDAISDRLGADRLSVKYAEVPQLLRVLALMMPIVAFEMATNPLSVASGKPRAVLFSNIASIAVLLACLVPLSARFGIFGVVASQAITTAASASTFAIVLRKSHPSEIGVGVTWTAITIACAALALAPVQYFAGSTWSWALMFPAVAIFVLSMLFLRVIAIEDFHRVFKLIRRGAA